MRRGDKKCVQGAYGSKSSDLARLFAVIERILHVVHSHAAPLRTFEALVGTLRNTSVGSISSFEVKNCGPIIALEVISGLDTHLVLVTLKCV